MNPSTKLQTAEELLAFLRGRQSWQLLPALLIVWPMVALLKGICRLLGRSGDTPRRLGQQGREPRPVKRDAERRDIYPLW